MFCLVETQDNLITKENESNSNKHKKILRHLAGKSVGS